MNRREEKRADEFCTQKGLEVVLGLTRGTVSDLVNHDPTFPKPERQNGRGNRGRMWRVSAVLEWMERRSASFAPCERHSDVADIYLSFWSRAEDAWDKLDENHRIIFREEIVAPLYQRITEVAGEMAERIVRSLDHDDHDDWVRNGPTQYGPINREIAVRQASTEIAAYLGAAQMDNGQIFVAVVRRMGDQAFSRVRPGQYAGIDDAGYGNFYGIGTPIEKSLLDLEDAIVMSDESRAKPKAIADAKTRNENRQRGLIESIFRK